MNNKQQKKFDPFEVTPPTYIDIYTILVMALVIFMLWLVVVS